MFVAIFKNGNRMFKTLPKPLKLATRARHRQALAVLATGLLLNGLAFGAQAAAPDPASALPRLIELLSGRFDNLQQMPFVASRAADDKVNHVEAMRIQAWPVENKQLDGYWIYNQTDKLDPADASKSKVYRQSLVEFFIKDGLIFSRGWSFKDPALKQEGIPSAAFLEQISPQQISAGMSDDCLTRWTARGDQFIGRIDPAICVIQSKYKNEKRKLFAEEIVFPSGVWFREGAYGEDGSLAFGLEEGNFVRFNRLRPAKP